MPYFMEQQGDQHCVMQGEKGRPGAKKVKCHATRAEALAHMRALMAKVPEAAAGTGQAPPISDPGVVDVDPGAMTLRALHDRLLADRPDGAEHDEGTCPFCTNEGGDDAMSERTFTEAEMQAAVETAVADAVGPLQSRLAELENSQQQSALERAVADARAETEATISDLQAKLDASVLEAAQAKEAKEAVEAAWAAEKREAEEAKELAARRDERLALVREAASFPEAYLAENADRFAALPDEEFQARLDEWRAIAGKEAVPGATSLKASRDDSSANGSLLSELGNFRRSLIDPRTV